jgi:integrase
MHTNITKGKPKSKHRDGRVTEHERYFLHYNNPATGKRVVRRFKRLKDAEAAQNEIIKNADVLKRNNMGIPTLGEAVEYWLRNKKNVISEGTYKQYVQLSRDWIIGPAIKGTANERRKYAMNNIRPPANKLVPMLGKAAKIDSIRTAQLRTWSLQVQELSTPYVARCARKALSSIFRMIEEDYDLRLARMPSRVGQTYRRKRRELLSEKQVQLVLKEAQRDKDWGVYYAFAFLTGTRPSEMLGLLWKDVDLDNGVVSIIRVQQQDGSLKPFTKTDAGMRDIPINSLLLEMLRDWQNRCPRFNGKLHRVFPAQGQFKGMGGPPKKGSDGGLSLHNYRNRVWYPMLKRLGLPQIAPYAARHMAISFLQAQGVEVGQVAKIVGHSSPQITLQYYTHAVSDNKGIMDKLNSAYGLNVSDDSETGVHSC